jgi:hypothetical protein
VRGLEEQGQKTMIHHRGAEQKNYDELIFIVFLDNGLLTRDDSD